MGVNPNSDMPKYLRTENPDTSFIFDDVNYGIVSFSGFTDWHLPEHPKEKPAMFL